MTNGNNLPDEPLSFIRRCVRERRIYWTYHVNMRMAGRHITRQAILESVDTFEIIESYPEDKYLPSYLVWAKADEGIFHVLFAVDVAECNVRVITVYRPTREQWSYDYRRRQDP